MKLFFRIDPQTLKKADSELMHLSKPTYQLLIIMIVGAMFLVTSLSFLFSALFLWLSHANHVSFFIAISLTLGMGIVTFLIAMYMLIKPDNWTYMVKRK
jgi:hypothetical protein